MDDSIEELTRKRVAYHPPPQRTDMSRRLDLTVETGTIQPPQTAAESLILQQHRWKTMKRKDAWSEHHSVWNIDRGRCNSENCPGRKRTTTQEANRSYDTRYKKCVECSFKFGRNPYFGTDFSNGVTRNCHD